MYGGITALAWTDDGQILTVATQSGTLLNFLAKIPNIVDSCGLRVAHLSSLRELSVSDTTGDTPTLVLSVSVEPSFVALGPLHVAVRSSRVHRDTVLVTACVAVGCCVLFMRLAAYVLIWL